MRFLDIILGAAAVGSALAAPTGDATTPATKNKRASKFPYVGVNESGAEFGNKNLPGQLGKDYTWPVHSTIDVRTSLKEICLLEKMAVSANYKDRPWLARDLTHSVSHS
jgi:hypothetical protein